jgi:hypothetical protein
MQSAPDDIYEGLQLVQRVEVQTLQLGWHREQLVGEAR